MAQAAQSAPALPLNTVHELPLDQIEPDKNQVRKEFIEDELDALAESIKNDGQLQPIHITKGKPGKYKIVDGERRWRALKKLSEQTKTDTPRGQAIPFSKIKAIYLEEEKPILGILANIARNNYNPMEMADAISIVGKELGEDPKDQDIANKIGKARSTVVEYKSLLKLPNYIQDKARLDSCVPLRKLIKLAASKKMNEAEKIVEYDKLHGKYASDRDKAKEKKAPKKPAHTKDTRSVIAVRKKLDEIKSTLVKVAFTENTDAAEKRNLLNSLQEIITAATEVHQRLSH